MEQVAQILSLPFLAFAFGILAHQAARRLEWDTPKDGPWRWKAAVAGTVSAALLYGLIEVGIVKVLPEGVGFWPWAAIGYAADSASAHVWKFAKVFIEKKAS